MKNNIIALMSGFVFGLGLCISRMVDPHVVKGFLNVTGPWNPALAFVMIGALAVTVLSFRFILKSSKPVCADEFCLPTKKTIDASLLIGSALFGIGWGLVGICPGPAAVILAFGLSKAYVFFLSMIVGMAVYSFTIK